MLAECLSSLLVSSLRHLATTHLHSITTAGGAARGPDFGGHNQHCTPSSAPCYKSDLLLVACRALSRRRQLWLTIIWALPRIALLAGSQKWTALSTSLRTPSSMNPFCFQHWRKQSLVARPLEKNRQTLQFSSSALQGSAVSNTILNSLSGGANCLDHA